MVGQMIAARPRPAIPAQVAPGAGVPRRQRADAARAQPAVVREPPIDRVAQARHAQVHRAQVHHAQVHHVRVDPVPTTRTRVVQGQVSRARLAHARVRPEPAIRAPMVRVLAARHRVRAVTHEPTRA